MISEPCSKPQNTRTCCCWYVNPRMFLGWLWQMSFMKFIALTNSQCKDILLHPRRWRFVWLYHWILPFSGLYGLDALLSRLTHTFKNILHSVPEMKTRKQNLFEVTWNVEHNAVAKKYLKLVGQIKTGNYFSVISLSVSLLSFRWDFLLLWLLLTTTASAIQTSIKQRRVSNQSSLCLFYWYFYLWACS